MGYAATLATEQYGRAANQGGKNGPRNGGSVEGAGEFGCGFDSGDRRTFVMPNPAIFSPPSTR